MNIYAAGLSVFIELDPSKDVGNSVASVIDCEKIVMTVLGNGTQIWNHWKLNMVDFIGYNQTCTVSLLVGNEECRYCINSLRPRDAYMRDQTKPPLVQIMARRLFGASHYLNQCCDIVNWTLRNKLQWNFNRKTNIFIQENAFEGVVCEMSAMLSRAQCANATPLNGWVEENPPRGQQQRRRLGQWKIVWMVGL